jgi:hypothetical protein
VYPWVRYAAAIGSAAAKISSSFGRSGCQRARGTSGIGSNAAVASWPLLQSLGDERL